MIRFIIFGLLASVLLNLGLTLEAQPPKKVYRVGFLSPRPGIEAREEQFRQSLRDLGYVEGQNLIIDWRFTMGNAALYPESVAELIRLKPDCLVVTGARPIQTLMQATQTIPIIMAPSTPIHPLPKISKRRSSRSTMNEPVPFFS